MKCYLSWLHRRGFIPVLKFFEEKGPIKECNVVFFILYFPPDRSRTKQVFGLVKTIQAGAEFRKRLVLLIETI